MYCFLHLFAPNFPSVTQIEFLLSRGKHSLSHETIDFVFKYIILHAQV